MLQLQPNLEDQLELAKEKVAQIKAVYTTSNTTMDLLSNGSLNRLSNITLNQEQVKEVETIRDAILYPCVKNTFRRKRILDAYVIHLRII